VIPQIPYDEAPEEILLPPQADRPTLLKFMITLLKRLIRNAR
jgi:hypothetical protein